MAGLRRAEDETGDKRAICCAETDQTGNRRPAETERQTGERRQFLVLGYFLGERQMDLAAP